MIWAGTNEGLNQLIQLLQSKSATLEEIRNGTYKARSEDDDEEGLDQWGEAPEVIQVVGNVGIISWSGSMSRAESWLTRLFEIPTYDGIKSAICALVDDGNVKSILLNMDTPGGVVDGVAALGRFISEVDSKLKPVYAFTSGQMCSAGYWLSAGTRRIYADENAHIGSIGVLAIHQESTKLMDTIGIKVSVFRSAPYKALANRFEKLSDLAKESINDEIALEHQKFELQVSEGRRLDMKYVHENIATGKVFDEKKAKELNMIDGIGNIETIVAKLSQTPDNKKVGNQPVGVIQPAKRAEADMTTGKAKDGKKTRRQAVSLPPDALAALALGVALPTDTQPAATTTVASEEADEADTDVEAVVENPPAAPAVPAVVATEPPAPVVPAAPDPVMTELRSQLSTAQTQLQTSAVQLASLTTARDEAIATVAALEPVVRDIAKWLSVPLGMSLVGIDTMTGSTLAQQCKAVKAEFENRFTPGRKSSPSGTVTEKTQSAVVTPIDKAARKATGLK